MKVFIISVVSVLTLGIGLFFLNKSQTSVPFIKPTSSPVSENVDIKANFTIITGGITRSFKADKYHNQSSDVYISTDDPTAIHVKKKGITYNDFFKTLPMTLTKNCLITGDGEIFCDGKGGTLKFYLNDVETPDLLDKEIKAGDKTLIKFLPE
jgi:hypothetical protein